MGYTIGAYNNYMADYQAKMAAWRGKPPDDEVPDDGPESRLQGKIVKYCKDHGYPVLSFRQSKKAVGFLTPGWPDITIVLKNRVLFLELKSAKGGLRKEQRETAQMMLFLGAEWYKVKSYKRFLEIVYSHGG